LIYHQVLPKPDVMRPYEVAADLFEQHLILLSENFTVLTLEDAISRLEAGTLPRNPAVITFDDGYENNASVALPLLQKYQLPATFFIASDFLNGGAMWNDKVIETVRHCKGDTLSLDWLPGRSFDISSEHARCKSASDLLKEFKYLPFDKRLEAVDKFVGDSLDLSRFMMTDAQVKELYDAGMEIGGHTCSHPILAKLSDQEAYTQIKENKNYLETLLNTQLSSFAFPNGRPDTDFYSNTVAQVKKTGYKYAVSTSYGVSDKRSDRFQLPRFTPWRNDKKGFLGLMCKNYLSRGELATR